MIRPVTRIDFEDYTELVPSFLTITLMSFTYNIGVGMTAGSSPTLCSSPVREARGGFAGMWVLRPFRFRSFLPFPK
jgi:AGZA family xanthine/uracil permease-like MFS transporter